jgi:uncharacterized alkaline shock family protein YloU
MRFVTLLSARREVLERVVGLGAFNCKGVLVLEHRVDFIDDLHESLLY